MLKRRDLDMSKNGCQKADVRVSSQGAAGVGRQTGGGWKRVYRYSTVNSKSN